VGHITLQEALVLRWAELCANPVWHDLAGKIELNGRGVIEMSPASNRHGIRQAAIGQALNSQLPSGTVIVECSVLTSDGVRVPDVAWASNTCCVPASSAIHTSTAPACRNNSILYDISASVLEGERTSTQISGARGYGVTSP